MSTRGLEGAARRPLEEAIREVEDRSSAEVVVALRARTGSYLALDLLGGITASAGLLAFLLFSPWEFSLWAILVFPGIAGVAGAVLVSALPPLVRLLVPERARRRRVLRAARATFVEKRVHQTRGRTGLLVYVSWLERVAAVVPDVGVEAAVPAAAWAPAVAAVEDAARRGRDVERLARAIAGLGDALAGALPRAADDVNELPDEVSQA